MNTPNYVCDLCGYSTTDQKAAMMHMRVEHKIENPGVVGMLDQSLGFPILSDGEGHVLFPPFGWLKDILGEEGDQSSGDS